MKLIARLALFVCLLAARCIAAAPTPAPLSPAEELQRVDGEVGRYGGHLVVGQRSEPKTLNPVTATDAVSRDSPLNFAKVSGFRMDIHSTRTM